MYQPECSHGLLAPKCFVKVQNVVSSGSVSDLQQDEEFLLKESRMNKNSPPEGEKS
jgi:hypothetical protein